jgi:hypothetical protein
MDESTAVLERVMRDDFDTSSARAAHEGLRLELDVTDPECIAMLIGSPPGRQRDELARRALRIGVLALRQAQGVIDADAVRNEGDRLVRELAGIVERHEQTSTRQIASTLKEYFDPTDGRFTERVERLVRRDGDLERVVRQQVSEARQSLAETLGEVQGPLLQLLSPTEDNELLGSLRSRVDDVVSQRTDHVLREFSLDNQDGALSRLVRELTARHGELETRLADQINEVVGEFSLDSEDSALSRLVRQVDQTQKSLSAEFSLDSQSSALARLRSEMLGVLDRHATANDTFRTEVLRALESMKARKEQAARSTSHGNEFEVEAYAVVEKLCMAAGDVPEFVGNTPGAIARCKIGDGVVTLGPDSAGAGARIVLEFKESQTYSLKSSLDEIEQARKNRLADVGIFVHSRKTAAAGLQPIQRIGQDIVVVWDAGDEASDIVLQSALSIAKAISLRTRAAEALAVNPEEMETAIRQIERQVQRLSDIRTKAGTIRSGAENIVDIATRMEAEIGKQLGVLEGSVGRLKMAEA